MSNPPEGTTPKRYDFEIGWESYNSAYIHREECSAGDYVSYDDYAALEAKLAAANERWKLANCLTNGVVMAYKWPSKYSFNKAESTQTDSTPMTTPNPIPDAEELRRICGSILNETDTCYRYEKTLARALLQRLDAESAAVDVDAAFDKWQNNPDFDLKNRAICKIGFKAGAAWSAAQRSGAVSEDHAFAFLLKHWRSNMEGKPLYQWLADNELRYGGVLDALTYVIGIVDIAGAPTPEGTK